MSITNLLDRSQPRIGLGCMNLSHAYGVPVNEKTAVETLNSAFDMGYRHFDTATLYGAGKNELLVGKALKHKRQDFFLASKCGMAIADGKKRIKGDPKTLREECENSLKRLQTDHIDLYYLHRLDMSVPIEESVGALGELVQEGKIGAIGLSEVSADTLLRGHTEYTISALQSEYSLWTRNPEIATLKACQDNDIAFVAFSPLARGFLGNQLSHRNLLEITDIRNNMPRFSANNYPQNLELLRPYVQLVKSLNCTPAQLALAWLLHQGEHILPIPGSRFGLNMEENLAAQEIFLSAEQLQKLDAMINQNNVIGARYSAAQQAEIDTETF